MRKLFLLLLVFYVCPSTAYAQNQGETYFAKFILYTEDNPPFSYPDGQGAGGLYVDLVLELFRDMGLKKSKDDIIVMPWARGFAETQRRKNSMLFSMVRTPEREALFKWIGPIGDYRAGLYARKDRYLDLSDGLTDKNLTYGVTQHSQSEAFLRAAGVQPGNLVYLYSPESAVLMLSRGRIDAWARDLSVAQWIMKEHGVSVDDYEVVHTFDVQKRYIALNRETDDKLVTQLQNKLDTFRNTGKLASITDIRRTAEMKRD